MGEAKSGKISLKLLVDRNENKVIFGEAGKDFVDFLFHFPFCPRTKWLALWEKSTKASKP